MSLTGFKPKGIAEHLTIAHPDIKAANTAKRPNTVVPKKGKGVGLRDGAVKGKLPPRSYHVIRVAL